MPTPTPNRGRPVSVTAVCWLFIVIGVVGTVAGLVRFLGRSASGAHEVTDLGLVLVSEAIAIGAAVLMLRGSDGGRWLLVVWMVGHVVIGALHSWVHVVVHVALFSAILWILFRPPARAYFRGAAAGGT